MIVLDVHDEAVHAACVRCSTDGGVPIWNDVLCYLGKESVFSTAEKSPTEGPQSSNRMQVQANF